MAAALLGDHKRPCGPLTLVCVAGLSVALRRYDLTMYRVTVMILMILAVIAAGVAAYWVASVALEWL
jgi:hypothetical protein